MKRPKQTLRPFLVYVDLRAADTGAAVAAAVAGPVAAGDRAAFRAGRGIGLGDEHLTLGGVGAGFTVRTGGAGRSCLTRPRRDRRGSAGDGLDRGRRAFVVVLVLLIGDQSDMGALVLVQELEGDIPEKIIHNALRHRNVRVAGEARRLKAGVHELLD